MRVIDPGHEYELSSLDGGQPQRLVFVKRTGRLYPGNTNAHPGTIIQEVLRALVERLEYLGRQLPCPETELSRGLLQTALFLLESRAAKRHRRVLEATLDELLHGIPCPGCGHIGCRAPWHRPTPTQESKP